MTGERAGVLLHGATGFTGKLVAAELAREGVRFAVSGRSEAKLAAIAAEHPASCVEAQAFSLDDAGAIDDAVRGRAIVIACAGPFVKVGMPMLAACAKLGVHYVDSTGEQAYVRAAHEAHHGKATASGACIVPGMAYEIAPADWVAHLASLKLGVAPDELDIVYLPEVRGGVGASTSRGTRQSMLRMAALGDRDAYQFVDGQLVPELPSTYVRTFSTSTGVRTAMSFPSPEAVVTPPHTGARTVRTFMGSDAPTAELAHLLRHVVPTLARLAEPLAEKLVASTSEGPIGDARDAAVQIFAEARAGARFCRATALGRDPYGLTARILVHAAKEALAGRVTARGVVAPSVGYPPAVALAADRVGRDLAISFLTAGGAGPA